jgi:hypothetical protein
VCQHFCKNPPIFFVINLRFKPLTHSPPLWHPVRLHRGSRFLRPCPRRVPVVVAPSRVLLQHCLLGPPHTCMSTSGASSPSTMRSFIAASFFPTTSCCFAHFFTSWRFPLMPRLRLSFATSSQLVALPICLNKLTLGVCGSLGSGAEDGTLGDNIHCRGSKMSSWSMMYIVAMQGHCTSHPLSNTFSIKPWYLLQKRHKQNVALAMDIVLTKTNLAAIFFILIKCLVFF